MAKEKVKTVRQSGLQCPQCGDKIFSDHRHDFRQCTCLSCFVDGGLVYFRYGWTSSTDPKVIYRNVAPFRATTHGR